MKRAIVVAVATSAIVSGLGAQVQASCLDGQAIHFAVCREEIRCADGVHCVRIMPSLAIGLVVETWSDASELGPFMRVQVVEVIRQDEDSPIATGEELLVEQPLETESSERSAILPERFVSGDSVLVSARRHALLLDSSERPFALLAGEAKMSDLALDAVLREPDLCNSSDFPVESPQCDSAVARSGCQLTGANDSSPLVLLGASLMVWICLILTKKRSPSLIGP